jgi:hypothetical protein
LALDDLFLFALPQRGHERFVIAISVERGVVGRVETADVVELDCANQYT